MPNVVPHVPDPDAIPPILFYIAAGVAGGVVGIGFMITYLATWGRKLFSLLRCGAVFLCIGWGRAV